LKLLQNKQVYRKFSQILKKHYTYENKLPNCCCLTALASCVARSRQREDCLEKQTDASKDAFKLSNKPIKPESTSSFGNKKRFSSNAWKVSGSWVTEATASLASSASARALSAALTPDVEEEQHRYKWYLPNLRKCYKIIPFKPS